MFRVPPCNASDKYYNNIKQKIGVNVVECGYSSTGLRFAHGRMGYIQTMILIDIISMNQI